MYPAGQKADTPLPPVSLLSYHIFAEAAEKNIEILERQLGFVAATRKFQQEKEKEVKKMTKTKSIRENLAELREVERKLAEETAAAEAALAAVKIAEVKKTEEVRERLAKVEKRKATYANLLEGWGNKLETMSNKCKQDEIKKNVILQLLDDQAMRYVVEPNTSKIVSMKFWNIDPNQPKAECAIFFKAFDVANLSLFELDHVAPMFPEFEEVSRKATETKDLKQLVIDCVRCWKNIYDPERSNKL